MQLYESNKNELKQGLILHLGGVFPANSSHRPVNATEAGVRFSKGCDD